MISKQQIVIFLCGLLFGAVTCVVLVLGGLYSKKEQDCLTPKFTTDEKPIVWYIPGYRTENVPQDEAIEILKSIFPNSNIDVKNQWLSNNDFSAAKKSAEDYARVLAIDLTNMNPSEREQIILVGHSLGGLITIRVMAKMQELGLCIRQGILIGTAESNKSPDICMAMYASRLPMINVWNRNDLTLRRLYAKATDSSALALGSYGYAEPYHPAYFKQYECPPISNVLQQKINDKIETQDNEGGYSLHFAENYLLFLENIYPHFLDSISGRYSINSYVCPENWKEVKSFLEDNNKKTIMEYNNKTKQYRVLSPYNVVICVGDKETCAEVFALATEWDDSTSLKHVYEICRQVSGLSQQDNKIKIDVVNVQKEWENMRIYHSWRLQCSTIDNRFRIVDPFDYERACGTKAEIENLYAQLEKILNSELGTGLPK